MNFDFINVFNYISACMLIYITVFIVFYSYRTLKNSIENGLVKNVFLDMTIHVKKFGMVKYICYEKYNMWRFCIQPYSNNIQPIKY